MGLAVGLGQGALVPGTGGVIGVGLKDEVLTGGKHSGHDTTTVSPRRGGNRRCSQGRYTVAAGATGLIHACRDASVKYAGERKTWGVEIGQHQLVKAMIAQVESNSQASRLLWMRSGWLKNTGRLNTREIGLAKWFFHRCLGAGGE